MGHLTVPVPPGWTEAKASWPYPSTAAIALTGASLEPEVVDPIIDSLTFTQTQTSGEES